MFTGHESLRLLPLGLPERSCTTPTRHAVQELQAEMEAVTEETTGDV
jgi:hypothetical protein